MNKAVDYLTQYFYLLAKEAETDAGDRVGNKENYAAVALMQQAQQALADSRDFQRVLAETVPEPLRQKSQQWLMRQLYRCKQSCETPAQFEQWLKRRLEKIAVSVQKDEALRELIQQIQTLPPNSRDRRNLIQTLLIEIQSAESRLRHLPNLSPELYNDALHETMLWFCEHLDSYDPDRAGPVTWFNRNLFYQGMKLLRSQNRPLPVRFTNTEKDKLDQGGPDAYDSLILEEDYQILDDLYDWVQQDRTGQLKRTSLTDRLDINVQSVIKAVLDRIRILRSLSRATAPASVSKQAPIAAYDLFSEQPSTLSQLFESLSSQLEYPPDKLRRFWRERCRPFIQDFLQQSSG